MSGVVSSPREHALKDWTLAPHRRRLLPVALVGAIAQILASTVAIIVVVTR